MNVLKLYLKESFINKNPLQVLSHKGHNKKKTTFKIVFENVTLTLQRIVTLFGRIFRHLLIHFLVYL
jgi:hypothetical protein